MPWKFRSKSFEDKVIDMTFESLIREIEYIRSRGDYKKGAIRPLEDRVSDVLDVIQARTSLLEKVESPGEKVKHLESIEQAILDLAHCGNFGTARYIADTYYRRLDQQHRPQLTLQ